MKHYLVALALAAIGLPTLPSAANAAPPILISVGHKKRHPTAEWTLPPGVQARVIELATTPETSTDGYFFDENVDALDTLEPTQTRWVYNSQLDPGTYYVHVAGIDEPCYYADLCPNGPRAQRDSPFGRRLPQLPSIPLAVNLRRYAWGRQPVKRIERSRPDCSEAPSGPSVSHHRTLT
jgi:hypothetical protein